MAVFGYPVSQARDQRLRGGQGRTVSQIHGILQLREIFLEKLVPVLRIGASRLQRRGRNIEHREHPHNAPTVDGHDEAPFPIKGGASRLHHAQSRDNNWRPPRPPRSQPGMFGRP